MLLSLALGLALVGATARLAVLHTRIRGLEELAITDALTGAFNRRHLDASLAIAVERRRRTGERASLVLFDVDRFKEVNDAIGHAGGDRVLAALAALVTQRLRRMDLLFRTGGEEFALLLAGARFGDALRVAEDLRARVAEARLIDERPVSISVGVSELGPDQCVGSWLAETDAALYRAKRAGRNRVAGRCADPALAAG